MAALGYRPVCAGFQHGLPVANDFSTYDDLAPAKLRCESLLLRCNFPAVFVSDRIPRTIEKKIAKTEDASSSLCLLPYPLQPINVGDRKSTRLNSRHIALPRMPS